MASRWLRGIRYEAYGTPSTSWWQKAYALWLRFVMDFTFQSENCGSGRSFVSTEKNGTTGSFAGSTYSFVDSSAPFATSDVGKWLVIKDNTNPVNAGIYEIIRFVSSTEIVIDFMCGYGEYPVAASGLSWWICAHNYELPTDGEYVRLQSRHTSGWAIELARGGWAYYGLAMRIAITGNWSGKIIGNFSGDVLGDNRYYVGLSTALGNGSGRQTFWAEGDYDGNWLHLIEKCTDTGGYSQHNATALVSVEFITPVSEGHTSDELIVLRGGELGNMGGNYNKGDRYYDTVYGRGGRTWSELVQGEVTGYLLDYTLSGYGNNFCRWVNQPGGRECNWRRDGKLEAFKGTYYAIDVNNLSGQYHILGYLNGHWSIPMLINFINTDLRYDYYDRACNHMLPLDLNGDRDVICVNDGIVIPWCGLSVVDR